MDYANILLNFAYSHYIIASIIIGFLSSFTIFVPSPFFVLIFPLLQHFSPFWLGILFGIGSALGELTGYYTGFFSERIFLKKYEKYLKLVEEKFNKYHPSFVIFIFAATPSPFDAVGLFCGLVKYDIKDFLTFTALGKIIKYWVLAYVGYYGMSYLAPFIHF